MTEWSSHYTPENSLCIINLSSFQDHVMNQYQSSGTSLLLWMTSYIYGEAGKKGFLLYIHLKKKPVLHRLLMYLTFIKENGNRLNFMDHLLLVFEDMHVLLLGHVCIILVVTVDMAGVDIVQ